MGFDDIIRSVRHLKADIEVNQTESTFDPDKFMTTYQESLETFKTYMLLSSLNPDEECIVLKPNMVFTNDVKVNRIVKECDLPITVINGITSELIKI